MKRLLLLLLLTATQLAHSQSQYSACVVDAEDGEPLPMVGVYLSPDHTTLTNFDGEFSIEALPDDTLRFTCAGRRTLRLNASQLPDTIRMEMLPGVMSEVTVKAFEGTLLQISRQMEKSFNKGKHRQSQYFYRQTSVMAQRQDIVEAFVDARSAVNLRNLQFLSGRHGKLTQQRWDTPIFGSMNLHHVLELGPMTFDAPFWSQLLTPLFSNSKGYYINTPKGNAQKQGKALAGYDYYQKIYYIDIQELDDEGRRIYRIDLKRRDDIVLEQPIMVGTLYVDKKTLGPMAFDGQVENMNIEFRRSQLESPIRVPVNLDFRLDYRHDHKYPEVADLGMQVSFDRFQTRTMVFNVEGQKSAYKNSRKNKTRASENMLSSIDEAGYDSTFWANNDVIKRTAEEQRIAEGTVERDIAKLDSVRNMRAAMSPLERLADRLQRFGEALPQEKVYVHMDNRSYFLGDTIWFAAYTRKTNTDTPSRMSRVLYAELWNHDGYLVERKLVEMQDGQGSGFFALPDTLYSGFFELRAYTRWQLNWGQTEHYHVWDTEYWFYDKAMAKDFFRDYDKLYSRVFPVYDKPSEPGDFAQDMTLRPLRRYFKNDPKPVEMRLSLFPEGGNLVAGVPCRMAFEAATGEGECKEGTVSLLMKNEKLRVKNEKGEEVTDVRTLNRGRGMFTFVPEEGREYEVLFTGTDGETARQKIRPVKAEGVALQVRHEGNEWVFDIHPQGEASRQPLGLTIMHEGVTSRFAQIQDSIFKIQNEELKTGINQVTIYDSIGHIYADRLFFVTRPELTRPTIAISGMKDQYEPFEEINLTLTLSQGEGTRPLPMGERTGERGLSLSVRDAGHSDNTFDSGNIMTEMLLASEIKGFVPQPDWFFERDDEVHRQGLDLLMMTQGWRRFSWQDMAIQGAWELTHPAEHTQIVTGTVNRYWVSEEETKDPFNREIDEHEQFLLENGMTESDYFEQLTERNENRFEWNNPAMAGTTANLTLFDGQPNNFRSTLNGLGRPNMAWNMRNVYENRDRIGAIADTRSGIYGMQGRSWQQTDYNALSFKQDRDHRQGMKNRDFLAMRRYLEQGNIRREVRVHAEFVNPANPLDALDGEVDTQKGKFKIDLPRNYGDYVFHLAASDTTKWKKKNGRKPMWIVLDNQTEYDKMAGRLPTLPEYYVRLNFPYPRWVRPYTYYQVHNAPLAETTDASLMTDGTHLLDQVTIRARHGGLRRVDYTKPAYVLDAYEAVNLAMDAGLIDHLNSFYDASTGAAAALIGDMGMYRHYDIEFSQDNSFGRELGPLEALRYDMLTYIDKIYIYTDYSPRREGDERYQQANQPPVRIDVRKYPDNSRRVNYRDRRYIMHGFALQEDFYHPDYRRNPPQEGQKDYRRTLYWNPSLTLDANGQANVLLYNNSQKTRIQVEAEGQTADGTLLFNK